MVIILGVSLFSQKVVTERIICYEVVPSYSWSFLLVLLYRVDAVPSYIVSRFRKQSHCALDNNATESENPTSQYHFWLGALPEIRRESQCGRLHLRARRLAARLWAE